MYEVRMIDTWKSHEKPGFQPTHLFALCKMRSLENNFKLDCLPAMPRPEGSAILEGGHLRFQNCLERSSDLKSWQNSENFELLHDFLDFFKMAANLRWLTGWQPSWNVKIV